MDGLNELDEIMNGPETAPVTTSTETTTTEQQPTRDEQGRFASTETEPTDHDAQAAIEGQGAKLVPLDALHASRKGEQTAKEEAEQLRRELAELRGQVTALTPRATPAEPAKPTNWYADPDKAIAERLTPIQQQVMQTKMETSFMLAEDKFGTEKLAAANEELGRLMKANDPSVAALAQQMKTSTHPYRDLVSWHERRQAMSEIGDDPGAFRDKERERIRAELMAELGIEQPEPVNGQQPSITKPQLKLPQSLSKLPGSGNGSGAADLSDAGIFNEAMSGR